MSLSTPYEWLQLSITAYVAFVNGASFLLMVIGYFALRKESEPFTPQQIDGLMKSPFVPSVSVLAPAFREAATIRHSVRSMLRLRHPKHEVIVINDGSPDQTLEVLIEEFRLYRSSRVPVGDLPTKRVRAVYESRDPIPLVVIDKENGGKADALNCGINFARHDLFCAIDADSLVESDALLQISRPFLEFPDDTMAVGGMIRSVNGCLVEHGAIASARAPAHLLARLQTVEYLRAFLAGRVALSFANTLLIISGAFGMFRRSVVTEMGGYALDTVGEDMELVVRLHRYRRERNLACRVALISDSVCWTEVPDSRKILHRQRVRWQRGCLECVLAHIKMLGNWRYGAVGLAGMPYFVLCEIIGPLVELTGYLTSVAGLVTGTLSISSAVLFFIVSVFFGLVMSVCSVLLEEISLCKYPHPMDVWRLLLAATLENFGYRQLTLAWRVEAIFQVIRKKQRVWGEMERRGFQPYTGGI